MAGAAAGGSVSAAPSGVAHVRSRSFDSSYSEDQQFWLFAVEATASVVSVFSSVFIVFCWVILRRTAMVHMNLRLLVWLSVSDIMAAVMTLLGIAVRAGDTLCNLMAFLVTCTDLFPVMWTAAMSFCLWYTVNRTHRTKRRGDDSEFIARYAAVCFGAPLALSFAGLAAGLYGDGGGGQCWIRNEWLRLVFFYVPLWTVITGNAVVYHLVTRAFRAAMRSEAGGIAGALSRQRPRGSKVHRLKWYPMVLAMAWSAGSLNRVMQCFGVSWYSLHLAHVGLARAHGLWNLIVYGSDPDFRTRILPILCPGKQQHEDIGADSARSSPAPISAQAPADHARPATSGAVPCGPGSPVAYAAEADDKDRHDKGGVDV